MVHLVKLEYLDIMGTIGYQQMQVSLASDQTILPTFPDFAYLSTLFQESYMPPLKPA